VDLISSTLLEAELSSSHNDATRAPSMENHSQMFRYTILWDQFAHPYFTTFLVGSADAVPLSDPSESALQSCTNDFKRNLGSANRDRTSDGHTRSHSPRSRVITERDNPSVRNASKRDNPACFSIPA
jgi:hypothetical protein